jgi:hypothetical protein
MTYQPVAQAQFVPLTSRSPDDCVPTCCAMGAAQATVGAKVVTHQTIRAAHPTPGGMSYQDAVVATKAVTGVQGEARFFVPPTDAWALLVAGHSLTVSIDTHATEGTKYATNGFLGGHSVFASRPQTGPTVVVKDPGRTTSPFEAWPWVLLVKAAMLRSGNRGMNLIVWPDTEGVTRTAVASTPYYDKPFRSASEKGKLVKGKRYTVTSTFNGGGWPNLTGGTSFGWHRLPGDVYVPGSALR